MSFNKLYGLGLVAASYLTTSCVSMHYPDPIIRSGERIMHRNYIWEKLTKTSTIEEINNLISKKPRKFAVVEGTHGLKFIETEGFDAGLLGMWNLPKSTLGFIYTAEKTNDAVQMGINDENRGDMDLYVASNKMGFATIQQLVIIESERDGIEGILTGSQR